MDILPDDPPTPLAEMRQLDHEIQGQLGDLHESHQYWQTVGRVDTPDAVDEARLRILWDQTNTIAAAENTRRLYTLATEEVDKAETIAQLRVNNKTLEQQNTTLYTQKTQADSKAQSLEAQLRAAQDQQATLKAQLDETRHIQHTTQTKLDEVRRVAAPPDLSDRLEQLFTAQEKMFQKRMDSWDSKMLTTVQNLAKESARLGAVAEETQARFESGSQTTEGLGRRLRDAEQKLGMLKDTEVEGIETSVEPVTDIEELEAEETRKEHKTELAERRKQNERSRSKDTTPSRSYSPRAISQLRIRDRVRLTLGNLFSRKPSQALVARDTRG